MCCLAAMMNILLSDGCGTHLSLICETALLMLVEGGFFEFLNITTERVWRAISALWTGMGGEPTVAHDAVEIGTARRIRHKHHAKEIPCVCGNVFRE
jgi:hypothetical protein